MSRRSIVAGNWKMHGTVSSVEQLVNGLLESELSALNCDVAVCPPALYVAQVQQLVADSMINVGTQNCSPFEQGAYTGEISAKMSADIGCKYVILGHSERRTLFAESDEVIAEKVAAVLEAGLVPIFCVGETLEQREGNETLNVITQQLNVVADKIGNDKLVELIIAYEPVWAIGTGKTASPEQAQEVHAAIRQWLASRSESAAAEVRIVYGGSVKAANAAELFAQADIDGGLIGGAALDANEFYQICKAAG